MNRIALAQESGTADCAGPGGIPLATCDGTTTIGKDLTITGHDGATLNGEHRGSVLTITSPADVTLNTLTIENGSASAGGGIYNPDGGSVTLDGSTVARNTASGSGGGIYNYTGATVILEGGGRGRRGLLLRGTGVGDAHQGGAAGNRAWAAVARGGARHRAAVVRNRRDRP